MKYFTKEWFADTILADMCFQVRKSSKAAKFSEKYYLSLLKEQKKWFIRSEKFIAKHNKVKFDLVAAEKAFEANCVENLNFVKSNLLEDILSRVADVRVLALGCAEPQIVDDITRFCGGVNARCEAVAEAYNAEVEKLAENIGWEKINLSDHLLGACVELCEVCDNGNFAFATGKEYTGVPCRIDLFDAKVITSEEGIVGSAVANIEILPGEDGALTFSALCQKIDGTLLYFSAEMKDFEVI